MIAIHDPTRLDPQAPRVAARLTANTTVPLEVVPLAAHGDHTSVLIDRLAHRRGGVVAIDAHGGGFSGDVLFDEDAETVLQHAAAPVLVIGAACTRPDIDTLVIVGDATTPFDHALDAAARWTSSFDTAAVDVVVLEAPSPWPDPPPADEPGLDAEITSRQLSATVRHVATLDPCRTVCDLATESRHVLLLVTATRWPGTNHWFSTARDAIRAATCPVLVVPAAGERDVAQT